MSRVVTLGCALLLGTTSSAPAEDSLIWSADRPEASAGLTLIRAPDSNYHWETIQGTHWAVLEPVQDYYRRASFLIRVDRPIQGKAWLVVEFLDRGYGLLDIVVPGQNVIAERHGVARLNTGKIRRAWFRFDQTDFQHRIPPGADIQLFGAPYIRRLSLTLVEPPREPLPDTAPAVRLTRPMELVISAGADSRTLDELPNALATMRQLLPLAKALGFVAVESYVKWNFVERAPGVFDWSYYDAIVAELDRHGLKWFPLLVVGSAYALPDWFFNSPDMEGFVCLEHRIRIEIPTIFNDKQVKYVRRFLAEFGRHYGSSNVLLGVRLGPSGNYGEAQYPATGAWGYKWGELHTHIGYWAGDPDAILRFREWVRARYGSIDRLNAAWFTRYRSFDEVTTFLPETALSPRMRVDFATWYVDSMTNWCEKWALWAREALPGKPIYQSSGGWGAIPIGTDYIAQSKSMAKVRGGIRLTNENDNYLNNFCVTRPAASAARHYGIRLGLEPAGFLTARGVVGRLFNAITNNADHLFYYHPNLVGNDQGAELWLRHAPLLDRRTSPNPEVAVFYPDTANKLSDEVMRYRLASAFFERAQALRRVADYEFASEQLILDGALSRHKVLIFLWGRVAEAPVLEQIDAWVRRGGIVIYPERQQQREGPLGTPEGDTSIAERWRRGDTGKGRVIFFTGHPEPYHYYVEYLRQTLRELPQLSQEYRQALQLQCPQDVFWSLTQDGKLVFLNYSDRPATVRLPRGKTVKIAPYHIVFAP